MNILLILNLSKRAGAEKKHFRRRKIQVQEICFLENLKILQKHIVKKVQRKTKTVEEHFHS